MELLEEVGVVDEVHVRSDIVADVTVDVMTQGVSVEVDSEQDGVSLRPSSSSIDSTLSPTLAEVGQVGLSKGLDGREEVLLFVVAVVVVVLVEALELQREGLLVFGRGGGLFALRGTRVGGGGE